MYLNGLLLRRRRTRRFSRRRRFSPRRRRRRSNRSWPTSLWLSDVTMLACLRSWRIPKVRNLHTEERQDKELKKLNDKTNKTKRVFGFTCWWTALCCGESSSAIKLGGWRSPGWLNLTHSSTVSFHFLQERQQ